jgi:HNH endonuclease
MTLSKGPKIKPLAERFWPKVSVHENACWEWIAGTNGVGYGMLHCVRPEYRSRKALATHVSWFLKYGKWPKKDLLHSCDNPPCTNPEHLSEGTHKQNIQQSVERGRNWEKRKTHCTQGHPYSEENTQIDPRGGRRCRICVRERPHSTDYYFLQCAGCMTDIVVPGRRYRQGLKKGQKAFYCKYRCFVQRPNGESRNRINSRKATPQGLPENKLHTGQNAIRRDRSTVTGHHSERRLAVHQVDRAGHPGKKELEQLRCKELPAVKFITPHDQKREVHTKICVPPIATLLAAYRAVAAIFPS